MEDKHTLTNQLQELVKDKYRVINHAVAGTGIYEAGQYMIDVDFEEGDIAISIFAKDKYFDIGFDFNTINVPVTDMQPFFNQTHNEEIFFDRHHVNPNGYKIMAKIINDTIRQNERCCKNENLLPKEYAGKKFYFNNLFGQTKLSAEEEQQLSEYLQKIELLTPARELAA